MHLQNMFDQSSTGDEALNFSEGSVVVDTSTHDGQEQKRLRVLCDRLELAAKASGVGVWEFNLKTGQLIWDENMRSLFGLAADGTEANYDDFRGAIHPDDLAKVDRVIERSVRNRNNLLGQFRILTPAGKIKHIRTYGILNTQDDGTEILVGANWDVSKDVLLQEELRASEEKTRRQFVALEAVKRELEHLALHDALTGLPNRRYMERFFGDLDNGDRLKGYQIACLHIDLDRFKEVNDTYGHGTGDAVLRSIGAMLATIAKDASFIGRIGGDEFVVFLTGRSARIEAKILARDIVDHLSRPLLIGHHNIRLGASVGVSSQSIMGSVTKLLAGADAALYQAKRDGRGRFSFLTRAQSENIEQTRLLADEVIKGLEQDQFEPFFQPQVNSVTHEITGLEALVRWNHPTRGVLAPDTFLSIAEELGKMAELDELILRKALEAFREWKSRGLRINRISVNVSAQRLREQRFLERISKLKFPAGSLSFELLESISFDGEDSGLSSRIKAIKALGIDVEIDDFGTGHASIVSLLELSPARLKIDRKLIAPLTSSGPQYRLVAAIVDIARTLGIGIIAEGVETTDQADILRDLGCQTLQGYFFSKARPREEIDGLLEGRKLPALPVLSKQKTENKCAITRLVLNRLARLPRYVRNLNAHFVR